MVVQQPEKCTLHMFPATLVFDDIFNTISSHVGAFKPDSRSSSNSNLTLIFRQKLKCASVVFAYASFSEHIY